MDSAQKENLSLVLRSIDSSFDIHEEFVDFVYLKNGLSGKAISDALLNKIDELGLHIGNCRGQVMMGRVLFQGLKMEHLLI